MFGVLGIVIVVPVWFLWENGIRKWLVSEIVAEVESNATLRDELALSAELREVSQAHLHHELTNGNPDRVRDYVGSSHSLLDALLYTDEVYILEFWDKRAEQPFDDADLPANGSAEGALVVQVSQLRSEFYASKDQVIAMQVVPDYGSDWKEAITSEDDSILLFVGTEDFQLGLKGWQDDITCVVRSQLNLRSKGRIQVEVQPKSGKFREGGFHIRVIIVAERGNMDCQA